MLSKTQPIPPRDAAKPQKSPKEVEAELRQKPYLTANEQRVRLVMEKAINAVRSSSMGLAFKDDRAHEAVSMLAMPIFERLWDAGEDLNTFTPPR